MSHIGSCISKYYLVCPVLCHSYFLYLIRRLGFFHRQNKGKDEESIEFSQYWELTKAAFQEHKKWLLAIFMIGAILMFILFGFLFYLSSILEEKFNYQGVWKGGLLAIPLLALSIAAYTTGKIIKDHLKRMKWITFTGIVLTGLSVAVIPFTEKPFYLLAIFLLCGTGIGMALPCLDALITGSFEKSVRGIMTSIYSAMRFIGVAAGPPAVALLMKQDIFWMVSIFSVTALAAGILAYRNINP